MMSGCKFICALLLASIAQVSTGQISPSPTDTEARADAILKKMTLEEKIDYIGGQNDFYIRAIPRLGVPQFKMSDGPIGLRNDGPSTAYPAGIALAASWDTELANRVGESLGRDARARGVHFLLGPAMNIYRAPMCGRNFEYLGEDPYLASRMAVSLIKGIQSQGVIATAKHFVANNQEFDRHDLSSNLDERTLREIYLPAFEASVKEGKAGAIMAAYNLVNGVHMTQNDYLNNQVVKKEWGFRGILMSDWDATYDGVAAANGGLDLEMPSAKFMNREALLPAVRNGQVSLSTIDDKLRRILRTTMAFGFFDRPQANPDLPLYSQQGREVALDEARAGMVLLKNSGNVLPLDKNKVKTIAIIGPDAYPAVSGGGGSSLVAPFNASSYLEGISNYLGTKARVLYAVDHPPFDEVWEGTQFTTEPGGEIGLRAEYFNNEEMAGPPVLVRTDRHVDFHWGEGSYTDNGPVDHFSARWTGYFVPKTSGDYRIYVSGDDGYRLYFDDRRVIDDWMRQGETLNTYTAHLEAGRPYKVRLEYFEAVGTATIDFGIIRAEDAIGRETVAAAQKADVAIVCVGFDPKTEGEGADRTFRLPGGQDELIQRISSVNKNTIVVLTAGGDVDMRQWIEGVRGLLYAWYPGQEGGRALAQIIFGDYSPSGKLPASFERQREDSATFNSYYPERGEKFVTYKEGVFLGYRHFDRSSVKPLFPFGFGLSYTTFAYSNLETSPRSGSLDHPITVSFDVKNTGNREAAEVAELYVGDSHASVPRPVKELKGFAKVDLQPGETKHVALSLDRRAFSYYDVEKKDWNAEPGAFTILVGSSSAKIELQGTFQLSR